MNRKKKINTILKKRAKKANAKNVRSNKPKYISKADRAEITEPETEQSIDQVQAPV